MPELCRTFYPPDLVPDVLVPGSPMLLVPEPVVRVAAEVVLVPVPEESNVPMF
jgi:hypothetical protein